jgi:hypothetical protein
MAPALASTERGRAEAIGSIIAGAAAPFKSLAFFTHPCDRRVGLYFFH